MSREHFTLAALGAFSLKPSDVPVVLRRGSSAGRNRPTEAFGVEETRSVGAMHRPCWFRWQPTRREGSEQIGELTGGRTIMQTSALPKAVIRRLISFVFFPKSSTDSILCHSLSVGELAQFLPIGSFTDNRQRLSVVSL
jgi:hypothetical protein